MFIRLKNTTPMRRLAAIFLCWTLIVPAPHARSANNSALTLSDTSQENSVCNRTPFGMPKELGTCIEKYGYENTDATRELLVIIDAHENLSAQYNIARILDHLTDHAVLQAIYLEGASGELRTDEYFSVFDDAEITRTTGDFLLKNGFITGAEYYYMTRKNPVPLYGAEKSEDYRDNLAVLRRLKQLNVESTIEQLLSRYTALVRENLNADFLQLDAQYMDTVLNGTDIMPFVTAMSETCGNTVDRYPVLSRFLYISRYGSSSVVSLIRVLSGLQDKYSDQPQLNTQIGSIKKQLLSGSGQYQAVSAACNLLETHRDDIDARILQAAAEYKSHLAYIENIPATELYVSILEAYKSIYLSGGYPSGLFEFRNALIGLFKGCTLTLGPGELSFFQINTMPTDSIFTELVARDDSAKSLVKKFIADGSAGRVEQAKQLIESFYGSVEQRNMSISAKLSENIPADSTAVLVIGGYHKDICRQFADNGFKVSLLAPALSLSSAMERDVKYTDYLSGVFSSLETMIYYAWSTIISPLISEAISELPSRKDAIAPVVARQLAFMLGTGLFIQRQYKDNITDMSIRIALYRLIKEADRTNESISRAFDELTGTQAIPKWPVLVDYKPLADRQGVFAVFSIGSEKFGIELLPPDVVLSTNERSEIAFLQKGYKATASLTSVDSMFNVTISALDPITRKIVPEETQAVADFFFSSQQTKSLEELQQIEQSFKQLSIPSLHDQYDKFAQELEYSSNNADNNLLAKVSLESQSDGGLSIMKSLVGSVIDKIRSRKDYDKVISVPIPGDMRQLELYLIPIETLDKYGVSAFTIPHADKVCVYLPLEYLSNGKIRELFQLLKHELDVNVYGVSPVMSAMQEAVSNHFKNEFGQLSDRLKHELNRFYDPQDVRATLEDLERAHARLGEHIKLETQVLAAIRRDASLSDTQKTYAEQMTKQLGNYARTLRMTIELAIAKKGGTLRGFTFKEYVHGGGFGAVYLVEKDGKLYIAKMVKSLLDTPELFEQFKVTHLHEAFLTQLVYGDLYQGDCGNFAMGENRFIAIPYHEGATLDVALPSLPVYELAYLTIGIEMAGELKRIHDKGIVFNDFKPGNILIKTTGSPVRIIDFGGAMQTGSFAPSVDKVTIATTPHYQSPEMQVFNECLDMLKMLTPQYKTAELSWQEFDDFTDQVERLAGKATVYHYDAEVYSELIDEILPDMRDRFADGEYTSFEEMITEVEIPVLRLIHSIITPQSDIYSFGKVLRDKIFPRGSYPGIDKIVDKCLQSSLNQRYQSIDQVIADLNAYREGLFLKGSTAAHWIATPVPYMENRLAERTVSWEKYPFLSNNLNLVSTLAQSLEQSQPETKKMLAGVFNDPSFDGGIPVFISILKQIEDQLTDKNQERLTINIPEFANPLHIYLVSYKALSDIGVNAVTVPYSDRLELFLPAELFSSESGSVFFQLLKHEIDEAVLGYPHTVAVLLESILNTSNPSVAGMLSDRIDFEFSQRLKDAQSEGGLPVLYKLGKYFRNLISNEQAVIEEIKADNQLTQAQRDLALQLSAEITQLARMYGVKTDQVIAGNNGTLHGFTVIKSIGRGFSGEVFLAEKDGRKWAVKLLDVQDSDTPAVFLRKMRSLTGEKQVFNDVYNTAYSGYTGSFEKGENQFLAMPFIEASSLANANIPLFMDEEKLVEIAMNIVKACEHIEKQGFVHNDITPHNIYLDMETGFVKILDFGASVKPGVPLPGYVTVNSQFAPPELFDLFSSISHIRVSLQLMRSVISGTVTEQTVATMKDLLEKGFEDARTKSVYNQIIDIIMPQIEEDIGKYADAEQLIDRFETLTNEHIFSVINTGRDIYSVGIILDVYLFNRLSSTPLQRILDKAKSPDRYRRYSTFSEFYRDLASHHNRLKRENVWTIHWIGDATPTAAQARNAVASWNSHPITKDFGTHTSAVKEQIVRNYDAIAGSVQNTISPFDSSYDGGIARFIHILDSIAQGIDEHDGSQPYIEFYVHAMPEPLRLYLVDQENLHAMGVSALTVRQADATEMYLPGSLLTFANRHIFYQILKHEIDESIYFEPHSLAVLLESLLNLNDRTIGVPGDRVVFEFNQRLNYAVSQRDISHLHSLLDYFTGLIENEQTAIEEIYADTRLTSVQQEYSADLARNISNLARLFAMKTEHAIAQKNGVLRGFAFNKMLASNARSSVYLAQKDGKNWAVTMYNIADGIDASEFFSTIRNHPDPRSTALKFYDVYTGQTGEFINGRQPLLAIPYKDTTSIMENKLSFSSDEKTALDIAISIVEEFMKLEHEGIVHHHITPSDIFINKDDLSVQIVDFSLALPAQYIPSDILDTHISIDDDYRHYAAPEIKKVLGSQTVMRTILKAADTAFTGTIDDTFINTVKAAVGVTLREEEAKGVLAVLIPQLQMVKDKKMSSSDEVLDIVKHALASHYYGLIAHKADIYALGTVLKNDIFWRNISTGLLNILDKATALNPDDRYDGFASLRQALLDYRNSRYPQPVVLSSAQPQTPADISIASAQFVTDSMAIVTQSMHDTIDSWEKAQFDPKMATLIAGIRNNLRERISTHSAILKSIFSSDKTTDAGYSQFQEVLLELQTALENLKQPEQTITLNGLSAQRPLILHLAYSRDLDKLNTAMAVIPQPEKVEAYMPFGAINENSIATLLQQLKFIVDTQYTGIPEILSVISESLLNTNRSLTPGTISDRIEREFTRRMMTAVDAKSIDSLYELHAYLGRFIERLDQTISLLDTHPELKPDQKDLAKKMAVSISKQAAFNRAEVEYHIADIGGTLRGFEFIKKIGKGEFSSVYLARKDDSLWAVKMLKRAYSSKIAGQYLNVFQPAFELEQRITGIVYNDLYEGYTGRFDLGENAFIAMPYNEGNTLENIELPKKLPQRLETAIAVVEPFMRVEQSGTMFNDVKPSNVFINLNDGSARVIDFGCASNPRVQPASLHAVIVGTEAPYASPELLRFSRYINELRKDIDAIAATNRDTFISETVSALTTKIEEISAYSHNRETFDTLTKIVIPEALRKYEDRTTATPAQMASEIEAYVVPAMFSLIDTRSDIYSVGILLATGLLKDSQSPQIEAILARASEKDPSKRYLNFSQLLADLKDAYATVKESESRFSFLPSSLRKFFTAHFVGGSKDYSAPQLAEAVNSFATMPWKTHPAIDNIFLDNLRNYRSLMEQNLDMWRSWLSETIYDHDPAADAGLGAFLQTLNVLEQAFLEQKEHSDTLIINVPDQSKPIHLKLVDRNELDALATNGITVVTGDHIEIFLPYEHGDPILFTILKHELDEFVYGTPHTLAVMQESILDSRGENTIGKASSRIIDDFYRMFKHAKDSRSLTALYDVRSYFTGLIESQDSVIDEITANPNLTDTQKHYAQLLATDISEYARRFSMVTENEIAGQNGTLRGFSFRTQISEGNFGSVYLAQKDGLQYVVKLPKIEFTTPVAFSGFRREEQITDTAYNDVILDQGDTQKGHIPMLVIPYTQGSVISYRDRISMSEQAVLELSMAFIGALGNTERKGIIHNDIKPENVLFNFDRQSARLLDFGCAVSDAHRPARLSDCIVGLSSSYSSPECTVFTQMADTFKQYFKLLPKIDLDNLNTLWFAGIEKTARDCMAYTHNPQTVSVIVDTVIPDLKSMALAGQISSPIRVGELLEPYIIELLYSIIDHRSDVYAAGNMLKHNMFPVNVTSRLYDILVKATAQDSNQRYASFADMYADLRNYYSEKFKAQTTQPAQKRPADDIDSITAHWVAQQRPMTADILARVDKWVSHPIPNSLTDHITAFEQKMQVEYEEHTNRIRKTLRPSDPQFDGNLRAFVDVLKNIRFIMQMTPPKDNVLRLYVPGYDTPVNIHLVGYEQLDSLAVNALSVKKDGALNIYLPAQLTLDKNILLFFQLLKHELDEGVFGMSHTSAVLLESLLNDISDNRPGRKSDRVVYDIARRMESAFKEGSLEKLYELQTYFESLITREQQVISEIKANTALDDAQKSCAISLAGEISQTARFMGPVAEVLIAQLGGVIRGFTFDSRLGTGTWGTVYLAVKQDGSKWAVKLMNMSMDIDVHAENLADRIYAASVSPMLSGYMLRSRIRMHNNDAQSIAAVYNDSFVEPKENFDSGKNQFLAVPFKDGKVLSTILNELPDNPLERVDMAIAITEELTRLNRAGIIHNDIKPGNIFIGEDGSCRIIDFGTTINPYALPVRVKDLQIASTYAYTSPELIEYQQAVNGIQMMMEFIDSPQKSIPLYVFDNIKAILHRVLRRSLNSEAFGELVLDLIPAITSPASGVARYDECTITPEQIESLNNLLVKHLYTLVDTRSDIYSLGIIFNEYLFANFKPAPVQAIIDKTIAPDRDNRYRSFSQISADLWEYRTELAQSQTTAIELEMLRSQKWFAKTALSSTEAIDGIMQTWEYQVFSADHSQRVAEFADRLENRLPAIRREVATTLKSAGTWDKQRDAGIARFIKNLRSFSHALSELRLPQQFVDITVEDQRIAVGIHLVSQQNLQALGTNKITLVSDDRVDIYLSKNDFYGQPDVFFQNLKHELDVSVYGVSQKIAAVTDSLLNNSDQPYSLASMQIGSISSSLRHRFMMQVEESIKAKSIDEIYKIAEDFRSVIESEENFLSMLEADPSLTAEQKNAIRRLSENIVKEATFFAILTDQIIAERGGTLHGFKIIGAIDETPFHSRYLAEYGNTNWVITLLNAARLGSRSKLDAGIAMLQSEARIHRLAGDVLYSGTTGIFAHGENAFFAVAHKPLRSISDTLSTIPDDGLETRLDLALAVAKKLIEIEEKGIITNSISPRNIQISSDFTYVRLSDLSAAIRSQEPAETINHYASAANENYISPQMMSIQQLANSVIRAYEIIEKMNLTDLSDEDIIQLVRETLSSTLKDHPDRAITEDIIENIASLLETVPEMGEQLAGDKLTRHIDDAVNIYLAFIADRRSDIYSFGKILLNDIFFGQITDELLAIARKAANDNPAQRYTSFTDLYNALADYKNSLNPVTAFPDQALKVSSGNVAFGTICEVDDTRHAGLNELIKLQFRTDIKPIADLALLSAVIDSLKSWDYTALAANPQAGRVLDELRITAQDQWQSFIDRIANMAAHTDIYKLPADDYLLWVNQRFAAAHYGRFDNKNNIYLTEGFINLLSKEEQAQVVLHELLHLAGLNHPQADIIQQAHPHSASALDSVYNLVYFIANVELEEKIASVDQSEFQRFIDIFIPAVKQAMDAKKIFDEDIFDRLLSEHKFTPDFSKRITPVVTDLLAKYAQTGELPDPSNMRITDRQIELLIDQLDSTTLFVRMKAVDTLVAIGRPAVRQLIATLKTSDPQVKERILYILGLTGDPVAMHAAVVNMEDKSVAVQASACQAVINLSTKAHAPMLMSLIGSTQNDTVLLTALRALKKIAVYPSIDSPYYYLHQNREIRETAGEILRIQGINHAAEIDSAGNTWELIYNLGKLVDTPQFESALSELRAQGNKITPFLQTAVGFKDHPSVVRWSAILLGELGDRQAVRPLLELSRTAPQTIRNRAMELLQNPIYSEALLDVVSGENTEDSAMCAKILGMTKYAPAFEQLRAVVMNENRVYSFPTIQESLYALADNMDKRGLSDFFDQVAQNRMDRQTMTFDDSLLLLEIAVLIKQHSLKKATPVLRDLLRDPHPSIIKSAIEGLAELGDASDIYMIQLFGLRHEKLRPTVDEAVEKLNGTWSRIKASFKANIGFFAAGMPPTQFFTSDNYLHKRNLTGIDQIREFGDFEPVTVHIPADNTFYSFTIDVDTDFQHSNLKHPLSKNTFALMIENMLADKPDMARALHGKQITLALLTKSFRLSENHREDDFIGINEAIMRIADRGSMLTLLKELLLHELKHEAGLAPAEFTEFTEWESKEISSIVRSIISLLPYRKYLGQFIEHIRPAFSNDSFFIFILDEIRHGRMYESELDLLNKIDMGDSYDAVVNQFSVQLTQYRLNAYPRSESQDILDQIKALGVLEQDALSLISLPPQKHIEGRYENIPYMPQHLKQKIQNIFMDEYAQRLLSRLLEIEGYAPMFKTFFNSMILDDLNPAESRKKVTEFKQFVARKMGVTLDATPSSDGYFMSVYVMEYLMSLFRGDKSVIHSHPSAAKLEHYLLEAIKDREKKFYGQIRFNTDAVAGTPIYREAQKAYLSHLIKLAELNYLPMTIFTDEEFTRRAASASSPRPVKKIHIEQRTGVETSL